MTGSHEVSGSIPLISTKTKSHSVRNGFFVLAGHTWREKRCGSTECIFAAQKRRFFCMQCRKHKKMQSARSKRSLRSIPLIVPLSFLEKRMHFCSHATRPRFGPNGRENAVDLLRFIWQNSTNILFFNRFPNILTAAASCSRRIDFGVRLHFGWCFQSRPLRSVSSPVSSGRRC